MEYIIQELNFQDLSVGMVVQGVVQNVVNFGAFVNIGLKNDGLVHISEMANQFVRHPSDIVKTGDEVSVKIIDIDQQQERVKLSLKLD